MQDSGVGTKCGARRDSGRHSDWVTDLQRASTKLQLSKVDGKVDSKRMWAAVRLLGYWTKTGSQQS